MACGNLGGGIVPVATFQTVAATDKDVPTWYLENRQTSNIGGIKMYAWQDSAGGIITFGESSKAWTFSNFIEKMTAGHVGRGSGMLEVILGLQGAAYNFGSAAGAANSDVLFPMSIIGYSGRVGINNTIPRGIIELNTKWTKATGTVSFTASTTITGSGTSFLTQLKVGQTIMISRQSIVVASIETNTSLTVSTAFASSGTGRNLYYSESCFLVTDAGNVGLGTTAPLHKLHVAGTGLFEDNVLFENSARVAHSLNIGLANTNKPSRLFIQQADSGTSDIFMGGNVTLNSRSVGMILEASQTKSGSNSVRPGIFMFASRNDGLGLAFPLFRVYTAYNDNYQPTNSMGWSAYASTPDSLRYMYFGMNDKNSYNDNIVKLGYNGLNINVPGFGAPDRAFDVRGNSHFSGDVGIGTTTPTAKLHLISTTEQQRIGYDASNYYTTTVSPTGIVTFDAIGSGASFIFQDPVISNSYFQSNTTSYPNFRYNGANRCAFGETFPPPNDTGTVVSFSSGASLRNMLFSFSKTGVVTGFFGIEGTTVASENRLVFGSESTMPIVFKTGLPYTSSNVLAGGTEHMRILASGNIGVGTSTPSEKLEVNGNIKATNIISNSIQTPSVTVTATIFSASSNTVIFVDDDTAGNDVDINLPTAVGSSIEYVIKKLGNTGVITIEPFGSENIDGDSNFQLLSKHEVVRIKSDGANWWII